MSKYTRYERRFSERPWLIHPIWRGIGCGLIILVPLISFIAAHEIVNGALQFFSIPQVLLGYIPFPDFVWKIPILPDILRPIANYPNPLAVIVIGLIILILLSAIVTTIYAIAYRFIGPPRYSPVDAPPPKKGSKIKKSR